MLSVTEPRRIALSYWRRPTGRISPRIDRGVIDLDAAALRGDFQAQLTARREMARLDPSDPNHHRSLAEALMSLRDYNEAIVEFRRALTIRPDDPLSLNVMGYAAAYSGDLPTAIRVLRGYEHLRPNEPNPLDSLGDVHFALGHFSEAEQFYLAAHAKAPGFLNGGEVFKAAQARLMTGDVAGATTLFDRYRTAREAAHDPNAPYHAAAWSWQTGARRAAITAMDQLSRANASGPLHEVAARADTQTAFWLLEMGDRAGAVEHARSALAEAGSATSTIAEMVAFLANPEAFPLPAQFPLATMRTPTRCYWPSSFYPQHRPCNKSTGGPPTSSMMDCQCCWLGLTRSRAIGGALHHCCGLARCRKLRVCRSSRLFTFRDCFSCVVRFRSARVTASRPSAICRFSVHCPQRSGG